MKSSALIAVAASCAVLAAAGAGLASWAVVSAGQSQDAQLAGDDGVFVGDELNILLLTDAQVAALGIPGSVTATSWYDTPLGASEDCEYGVGQLPLTPAGARGIQISGEENPQFWQKVVQFPTVDDATAAFALEQSRASTCMEYVDAAGQSWTWTTVAASDHPSVIAGYSGSTDGPYLAIAIGQVENAISYVFAPTAFSSLAPSDLAATIGSATATQIAQ